MDLNDANILNLLFAPPRFGTWSRTLLKPKLVPCGPSRRPLSFTSARWPCSWRRCRSSWRSRAGRCRCGHVMVHRNPFPPVACVPCPPLVILWPVITGLSVIHQTNSSNKKKNNNFQHLNKTALRVTGGPGAAASRGGDPRAARPAACGGSAGQAGGGGGCAERGHRGGVRPPSGGAAAVAAPGGDRGRQQHQRCSRQQQPQRQV